MSNRYAQRTGGFTLIELLVVIAIISVLSTVILVSLNSARAKADQSRVQSERHGLQNAFAIFFNNQGYYPDPGNIDIRNCIAQTSCIDGGIIIPPLNTGDFTRAPGAAIGLQNWYGRFLGIQTAEASQLGGIIGKYPHSSPVVAISGLQYSGPFYVCNEKNPLGRCTSASILWTSTNNSCDVGSVANSLTSSTGTLCKVGAVPTDSANASM